MLGFTLDEIANLLSLNDLSVQPDVPQFPAACSESPFLNNVGLGYLSLSRSAATLSGGESQRIRLATQIGSQLMGVLYILDEPSIGLHSRDNARLLSTLKTLRDIGNSILVVEHDQETMESSDFIIDIGPKAGKLGGEVVFAGEPKEIYKSKNSLTGKYLSGELEIPIPLTRRDVKENYELKVMGASGNNLKKVNVNFSASLVPHFNSCKFSLPRHTY